MFKKFFMASTIFEFTQIQYFRMSTICVTSNKVVVLVGDGICWVWVART